MANKFQAVYACQSAAGFSFRVDENRYRFEKHQLIITNETEAAAIDTFLEDYPLIGGKVKKVDLAAAEALVQQHKDTHGGAHSGVFSSSAMSQMETDKLENRDAQFAKMSPEDKANVTEALATEGDLILTEKVDAQDVSVAPVKPVNVLSSIGKKG